MERAIEISAIISNINTTLTCIIDKIIGKGQIDVIIIVIDLI